MFEVLFFCWAMCFCLLFGFFFFFGGGGDSLLVCLVVLSFGSFGWIVAFKWAAYVCLLFFCFKGLFC